MALTIRAEDKRKWIVGSALLALAALLLYRALFPPAGREPARPAARRTGAVSVLETPAAARPRSSAPGRARRFEPLPLPGAVDPKLRLDLLLKAAGVSYDGMERNIFQYHTPPPPPPKPVEGATVVKAPGPPPPPPPPPIPLKYYGYAHKPSETAKKAFLVDGEEIFIASEGEVVNKRYRIVKIGVNTVEVEDLVSKHKQTLPLQES